MDNYPPPETLVRPQALPQALFHCESTPLVKWLCLSNKLWVAVIQSEILKSGQAKVHQPSTLFRHFSIKSLFFFSQRRFINQRDRVSVRNCSVQSFFKWDISLSRWQMNLTKRGQCCYFKRKIGLMACLAAAVREGVSNWMSEWMSESVIEWRVRADNMLTDWQREATAIGIDRRHTDPKSQSLVAPLASGAQPGAGLSACMIAYLGKYFIRYNATCWFLSYHTIFEQLMANSDCLFLSLKRGPCLKSGFLHMYWQTIKTTRQLHHLQSAFKK